ncbi:MAG: glycine cleavage system protein GcvH [Dehalococcoidia bacterium]
MYPEDLRYYKEHEWVRVEGDGTAVMGISHFAQEQLGDIVYVDLPSAGTQLDRLAKFGEIESVKAVNDLFTPIGGEVLEANGKLKNSPELVNEDPYGEGWMLRIKLRDAVEVDGLMTAQEYQELVESAE